MFALIAAVVVVVVLRHSTAQVCDVECKVAATENICVAASFEDLLTQVGAAEC